MILSEKNRCAEMFWPYADDFAFLVAVESAFPSAELSQFVN
jgi:hypothetical protein